MDLAFHLGFLGDHAHLEMVAVGVSEWWGVNIVRWGGGGKYYATVYIYEYRGNVRFPVRL